MKFILATLALLYSLACSAAESIKKTVEDITKNGEAFALYIENDSRAIGGPGSDQAYSNGFKFSYIYAEDQVPKWSEQSLRGLNFLGQNLEKTKVNFGMSLGHQIYTPNNTATSAFLADDRPYAGWLYLGFAVTFKEESIGQFFELSIGTVGPSAIGQQVQNNYHDLIGRPRAEGWDSSLHDEPTLQLFYQKQFKTLATQSFDFIPFYGASIGNVSIGSHIGGLIRYGVNLPDDFGPSRPSAGEGDSFVSPVAGARSFEKSYYIFSGVRGNAQAKNIFLDGNTFQSSHRVKKYPFTFETEFGFGLQILPFGLVWRFVTRSPEFEERSMFNSFASININYFL